MDTQDSSNFGAKKSPASRARAAAVAGIVVVASITGVTVSAQIYGLKGINGQLQVEPTGNWLPVGLNATFAHAMMYRNSHLRSIANHVLETGKDMAIRQYAQALVRKVDDWDARIIERLKANGVESSYADNELNKSYQGVEDLAKSLATLTGTELDAKFKEQMISLAKLAAPRLKNDISLLDDKELEGIAAEIAGSNKSVSQDINAG